LRFSQTVSEADEYIRQYYLRGDQYAERFYKS
jgi:hypothetical protein